ncbi:MAG: LysR family transcriptional regulator, partial [Pseudomonadota bacterium]
MSDLLSQKSSANFNTRADAPQSIPPHLLVSFLGVAQHRSMSHAATVQCIPHGQMTQHMTRLETMIGAPLFQGQSGKLVLTSLGERLYSGIKDPMESLQIGASHLVGGQVDATPRLAAPRLRISLQIWGLAALLQPYLMDLQGLGADLNFVSAKQAKTEPPDVLCYLGRAPMDGYACEPLVGEEIISVCSDRYPLPKGGFSGVGLRTEPLLSLAHPDHLQDWHGFLGMDPDSSLPGIDKAPYQSF